MIRYLEQEEKGRTIDLWREAFHEEEHSHEDNSHLDLKELFMLAIATSIDALAVGVSFAVLDVNIWTSSLIIGVVTFIISFLGGTIGFKLGERFRNHATRAGGLVLCLIGIKVLLEHTGYL